MSEQKPLTMDAVTESIWRSDPTLLEERWIKELDAERAVSAALLAALKDVLDTLGALSNPSELSNCMGEENSTRIFAAIALAEGRHE